MNRVEIAQGTEGHPSGMIKASVWNERGWKDHPVICIEIYGSHGALKSHHILEPYRAKILGEYLIEVSKEYEVGDD